MNLFLKMLTRNLKIISKLNWHRLFRMKKKGKQYQITQFMMVVNGIYSRQKDRDIVIEPKYCVLQKETSILQKNMKVQGKRGMIGKKLPIRKGK